MTLEAMANITPWPHNNIVIGKKITKLLVVARRLLAENKGIEFANLPDNKFVVKYSYGTKLVTIKPAYVYYLKLTFVNGTEVYKIGYTSMSVRKRIAFFKLQSSTRVDILETIRCKSSRHAYHIEQLLHREFVDFRYNGISLIASGNSELYYKSLT